MTLIDWRRRAEFGNAEWTRLAEGTSNWPLHAWFTGRSTPKIMVSVQRFCFAVLLWASLILAHATLFGVSPWPI
jgi:uncharacterized membrane protein